MPSTTTHEGKTYLALEQADMSDYLELLQQAEAKKVVAEKSGAIIARQVTAPEGEDIVVFVKSENGKAGHEATEHADCGRWIVTRADIDTQQPVVIDDEGHTNTWSIGDDKIHKKYNMDEISESGFVKPKGGEQEFVQISENIAIQVPWGKDGALVTQYLDAGAYLNITDRNDVYGIAETEFGETYTVRRDITHGDPEKADAKPDKKPAGKDEPEI